jgi:hypothetical protein
MILWRPATEEGVINVYIGSTVPLEPGFPPCLRVRGGEVVEAEDDELMDVPRVCWPVGQAGYAPGPPDELAQERARWFAHDVLGGPVEQTLWESVLWHRERGQEVLRLLDLPPEEWPDGFRRIGLDRLAQVIDCAIAEYRQMDANWVRERPFWAWLGLVGPGGELTPVAADALRQLAQHIIWVKGLHCRLDPSAGN